MPTPIIVDQTTGEGWTLADVERMRTWLEAEAGLSLADMPPRSVVANYRSKGGP